MYRLLAVLFLISAPALADSPVLPGVVARVIDGDTIDVRLASGLIRVRLNGIDAPELSQPGGQAAKAALSLRVLSKQVELEPFKQDRYDRLVADVLVDGSSANTELVKSGLAWAYRRYMTKANASLCDSEASAREARIGLWSTPAKQWVPPWSWRRKPRPIVNYSDETAERCRSAIGR